MARATYVYIVIRVGLIAPVAAFTVKHEMCTWLERNQCTPEKFRLWRVRDGVNKDKEPQPMEWPK